MKLRTRILTFLVALLMILVSTGPAIASCCNPVQQCDGNCTTVSQRETQSTIAHLKEEFKKHRKWMVDELFAKHLLPALMLFAEQMTAMAMHQVMVIGSFLDAKHQLETQRLFQELTAQAHKDYHPSEGMCTFGTTVRSLAASDRNTDLSAAALAARGIQRELLSGNAIAANSATSDYLSRVAQFRVLYCDKEDNARGLENLCPQAPASKERVNNDINYTRMVDSPLTLKLDFTAEGDPDHSKNKHVETVSADEEDIFALSANLYAHNVAPAFASTFLSDENGEANIDGIKHYINVRSIAAKRSVARNSFAAIAAMKSQGEKEVQPYLFALIKEMGIADEQEIKDYLGDRPSYYAQMEVLTKKLYQNPLFYSELYDKPANVERKAVAMQAIELMQRRDMYRSVLRSEATLSVMLETALIEQQEALSNKDWRGADDGSLVVIPD